jgi:hypothetical protein
MRVLLVPVLSLLFLSGNVCFAQQAKVKRFTAPLAGTVILRDVDDKYNARVTNMEMPEPDAAAEQKKLQEIKAQIKQNFPHKKSPKKKTSSTVLPPIVGISFITDSNSGIPPDNYSAVSKGYKAVSVINQTIAIHDATTGAYLYRKGLYNFSLSVGLNNIFPNNNNYRFDPKVVYDPVADRFICVILNGINASNWIIFGFSKTNDPAGAWNFYKTYGDYTGNTTWFDYPAISLTQNEFFLTGNKIKYDSSWQAGFTRSLIYQVNKQSGYDGDSLLTYQIWDSVQNNGRFLRCLYPLNPGNALLGPSQYFLSNRNFDITNDTVFLVKVPDTIGSADTILTVTPLVSSTGAYGVPPSGRQTDTTYPLATNDGRILGGFIKDNEIQFVSASLDPATGASAVFHGVISNFNTTPAFTGQLFGIDSLDFGYPNISFAGSIGGVNHSIISFDYSGPNTFAGYGATYFDGANYSDMVNIKSGTGLVDMLGHREQRWGDYSGSQPDWNTPGSVWVEGIFGKPHAYGNYMAQLNSPYRVGVPVTPAKIISTSKLYPNPAFEFVSFDFTVDQEQQFSFIIYDMQGKVVEKILDNYCHEGKNVINFNILPLKPGNYILKATGSKGENIAVHSFIRK